MLLMDIEHVGTFHNAVEQLMVLTSL
jgi:hypothetical protein